MTAMVREALHRFVRKYESRSVETCFQFLTNAKMDYLRSKLNYDVRSEFGNFRVLMEIWLKIFDANHVRLIEFYEGAYDDRLVRRHESLIELFLVTLTATILGEEYRVRRKSIGKALQKLQQRCKLSLQYLLDMDALKYLLMNQIIDHDEYERLSRQLKGRLRQEKAMPEKVSKSVRQYYALFGMSSSSDVIRGLERTARQRASIQDPTGRIVVPKGAVTIVGVAASPGVAEGTIRLIRNQEETKELRAGEIGVFHTYTPEIMSAPERCSGIIGTGAPTLGVRGAGGVTGHLASFARGVHKPAVVLVDDKKEILRNGKFAIVDGRTGKIHVTETGHTQNKC